MELLLLLNAGVTLGVLVYLYVLSTKKDTEDFIFEGLKDRVGSLRSDIRLKDKEVATMESDIKRCNFMLSNPPQYREGDNIKGAKIIKKELVINYVGDFYSKSNKHYYWKYECYDKKENKIVFHTEDED
tara:strand:+ start:3019 stop:3405 length:387 start_codon:yes stop_codon:yes gene_type:complete